jgi:RNA polymerase sigma factor (sigma-70 family)
MPITPEKFEALMAWLGPDREQAAEKYLYIRQSLIQIFTWRGVDDAATDELADETFNRVTERIQEIGPTYRGDPALFFLGVARKLIHEYFRTVKYQVPLTNEIIAHLSTDDSEVEVTKKERAYECLKACLKETSPENRELLRSYYSMNKQAKIDRRKELAQGLGINLNHLRVRLHRIRASLHNCIIKCLENDYSGEERD